MRNIFLLSLAAALLVSLSLAQTPAPVAMTLTAASIKGCLGGTDGAYTVAQDGSTQTLKISASSVDLKPHIGHQVELTGQKSSAAVFGSPETVSVTGVSMISEHCPMTAASAPAADPTKATLGAPAATAPAATAPATTAPATTATAAAPAAEAVAAAKPADSATTTTTTTVSTATATPAAAAAPVVLASATTPLPNTAPAPLKAVKVTGKVGDDGKTFVNDKDSKSWTISNPDAVKGHEGHHVTLTAHLDATKSEVDVVSLKMAK